MDENRQPHLQMQKNRRGRSIAIAVSLGIVVALIYAVTVFKLGANVMNRPL